MLEFIGSVILLVLDVFVLLIGIYFNHKEHYEDGFLAIFACIFLLPFFILFLISSIRDLNPPETIECDGYIYVKQVPERYITKYGCTYELEEKDGEEQ